MKVDVDLVITKKTNDKGQEITYVGMTKKEFLCIGFTLITNIYIYFMLTPVIGKVLSSWIIILISLISFSLNFLKFQK